MEWSSQCPVNRATPALLTRNYTVPGTSVGALSRIRSSRTRSRSLYFTPVRGPQVALRHRSRLVCSGFKLTEDTYKYEGRAAQMRLKNRITKHESRNPSPKTAGPSVPDENLSNVAPVRSQQE